MVPLASYFNFRSSRGLISLELMKANILLMHYSLGNNACQSQTFFRLIYIESDVSNEASDALTFPGKRSEPRNQVDSKGV